MKLFPSNSTSVLLFLSCSIVIVVVVGRGNELIGGNCGLLLLLFWQVISVLLAFIIPWIALIGWCGSVANIFEKSDREVSLRELHENRTFGDDGVVVCACAGEAVRGGVELRAGEAVAIVYNRYRLLSCVEHPGFYCVEAGLDSSFAATTLPSKTIKSGELRLFLFPSMSWFRFQH